MSAGRGAAGNPGGMGRAGASGQPGAGRGGAGRSGDAGGSDAGDGGSGGRGEPDDDDDDDDDMQPPDSGTPAGAYEVCRRDRDCEAGAGEQRCRVESRSDAGPPGQTRGFCAPSCNTDVDCPAAESGNARPVCRERSCSLDCRDPGARCPDDLLCLPVMPDQGGGGRYCLAGEED
jgi:hypothetical protein